MLKTLPASAPYEEIAKVLDEDGCLVLKDAIDRHIVDRVIDDLTVIFNKAHFGEGLFVGYKTKRLGSILKKSGISFHMLMSKPVLAAMEHQLGPYCERFQVNLTQAIQIYPGERAQFLHRDDELFPCKGFQGELMSNALWALEDFTRENGATQLVPGSHKWVRDREPQPHEIVQAEMKKGSVLIYRGSLIHGGGENISSAPRAGLVFSYNLGWLRQGENQYLAYPPQLAQYLPRAAQELIGYTVHRPNLGQYECCDPRELLTQNWKPDEYRSCDFLTREQEELAKSLTA
jgi:ectoine hydroxylase-related dioxygenase (phytanoyl-CoA dioxygenase family)